MRGGGPKLAARCMASFVHGSLTNGPDAPAEVVTEMGAVGAQPFVVHRPLAMARGFWIWGGYACNVTHLLFASWLGWSPIAS